MSNFSSISLKLCQLDQQPQGLGTWDVNTTIVSHEIFIDINEQLRYLTPYYRLMVGFMFPTWFLSMWISNTATTSMMIPVVEAVLHELEGSKEADIPGLGNVR